MTRTKAVCPDPYPGPEETAYPQNSPARLETNAAAFAVPINHMGLMPYLLDILHRAANVKTSKQIKPALVRMPPTNPPPERLRQRHPAKRTGSDTSLRTGRTGRSFETYTATRIGTEPTTTPRTVIAASHSGRNDLTKLLTNVKTATNATGLTGNVQPEGDVSPCPHSE